MIRFLKLFLPPRLEITCKSNKNCTEKIMVPLKFLRKRSSRFGATCWGITTHQANRADGLCKYCKGLPHPSACASLWVVIPQHVAPNLELLFLKNFNGTINFPVQFLFHLHVISRRGVPYWWLISLVWVSQKTFRRILLIFLWCTAQALLFYLATFGAPFIRRND